MADNDSGDLWGSLGYSAPSTTSAQPASAPPVDVDAMKAIVQAKAAKYGIPSDIADRWAQQESSYNPKATSKKGARGLTQLMPDNIEKYGVKDPDDPDQNADAGAQMLSELHAKYGEWPKALAAYNAGEGAVDKAGGVPDIPETQHYVSTIMGTGDAAKPSGDLWGALGYKPGAAKPDDTSDAPQFINYKEASPKQQAFYAEQVKGGVHDETAPVGSEGHPYFETASNPMKATPPGAFVVDKDGVLHKMPGGPKDSSLTAGLEQGVGDVAASIAKIVPGDDDSTLKNALLAGQKIYGAKYGGDLKSGTGRFLGQLGASAPILATGESALAPILENAGPVGAFLAGKGGQIFNKITGKLEMAPGMTGAATRGASLATHGAQTGAGAAALTSSANEGSLGDQMIQGAEGGALLGPVVPAAVGAGRAAAAGVKSLVQPLTSEGRAAIANKIVSGFASEPVGAVNAGEIVPGSVPTLGQASADPGIATLERTVRLGEHGPKFTARDAQNSTARSEFLDSIRGDEQHISDLTDARETATGQAREAALAGQTKPADIAPVVTKIDDILKGPEGKRPEVVKALSEVRDNLYDADGNPETDAKMLYGVRKSIGDLLDSRASSEKSGAKLATSQLMDVKGALDDAIQAVAPGFKEYLKDYSDLSKPISEARWLQQQKLTDVNGNPTLAKVQGALDRITAQRAKPGTNDAKSISGDTIDQLTALRDDLKRAGNLTLQKPGGSDTAQYLTTGGRLQAAGLPVGVGLAIAHHPVGAAALGAGRLLYGMKDKQIMSEIANRLLNPEASPVTPAVSEAKAGLLKRLAGTAVPAAGGLMMNNRLLAQ